MLEAGLDEINVQACPCHEQQAPMRWYRTSPFFRIYESPSHESLSEIYMVFFCQIWSKNAINGYIVCSNDYLRNLDGGR